ncbi:MAG: mandelate racemase/muconate lactonizing enzyme family protein [Alphaproteobacteria bacterium]|nr:mandelate racemase/muconate lactonizing enzyme family protein [Alphaproteobacteria bacterium]
MKISGVEITHHRLPLDPPFEAAWDSQPRRQFQATIVRVRTDEGLEGIGLGDLMLGFAGHEQLFLGRDPLELERHNRVLDNLSFHYGRCWPLDLALWDLAGKIKGQPCWRLLGGRQQKLRTYASTGTRRLPAALADAAEAYLALGFKAMKIRFRPGDWRNGIAVLEAVRKRVGARLDLMVDCNQGWRMPWDTEPPWMLDTALEVAHELKRLDIYWMEEPLHRGERHGMRRLRELSGMRIAGGEMNRELYEYRDLLTGQCLDVVQPDATLVGGLTGLAKIASMAQEAAVAFTPHTWGNGIGVIANAHLAAGAGDGTWLEFPFDPPQWTLERRDFPLAQPFDVDAEGCVVLSEQPGLGLMLNEELLARTRFS